MITPAELVADITYSLTTVLPEQRWFAGKGRPVHAVIPVRAGGPIACGAIKRRARNLPGHSVPGGFGEPVTGSG
jgi:hypothetical protein